MKGPRLRPLQPLRPPDFAQLLLDSGRKFPRGRAGRPWPSSWAGLTWHSDPARALLFSAFFGKGLDDFLTLDVFLTWHYRVAPEGQGAIRRILQRCSRALAETGPNGSPGLATGFFSILHHTYQAVARSPVDPNGCALALALVKLGGSAKAGDLVNEAQNFFSGIQTGPQLESRRSTLFRSARRLLTAYRKLKRQDPEKMFRKFFSQNQRRIQRLKG